MGNLFTTETSSLAVGDYNDDPDAEGYLLDAVTLIDAEAGEYRVADLPDGVGFTFRDLGRGPGDSPVVLGSDGAMHVLDEETGKSLDTFPVIEAWEGPAEWQDAHPALRSSMASPTSPTRRSAASPRWTSTTGDVLATSDRRPACRTRSRSSDPRTRPPDGREARGDTATRLPSVLHLRTGRVRR